jgi:hypothetical protein
MAEKKDIIESLDEHKANMIRIEEDIFDSMPQNSKWTHEDMIMAVTYMAILGSSLKTATHMAAAGSPVPATTIRSWKNTATWWKPVMTEVRKAKNEELDAKLTNIIMTGAEQMADRLEHGNVKYDTKTGAFYRQPLTSSELSTGAIGTMYDKRALMRGDPTSRSETTSTDETLRLLAQRFIEMTSSDKVKPALEVTHEVVSATATRPVEDDLYEVMVDGKLTGEKVQFPDEVVDNE